MYAALGVNYRNVLRNYFHMDGDHRVLESAASLSDGTYDGWLIVSNMNISDEKRVWMDTCIQFYKALKNERNTTNHAEETGDNHMDYRNTRKAIEVFAEMCRRLKLMN